MHRQRNLRTGIVSDERGLSQTSNCSKLLVDCGDHSLDGINHIVAHQVHPLTGANGTSDLPDKSDMTPMTKGS